MEFIADAISTLGANVAEGFETYHVMNPYDDGISMDTYVDWLIEAGYPIARVPEYATWLARFETTLRALPEKQRQASLLPLLHNYQQPQHPINGSLAPADRFRAAVQDSQDRAGQGHPAHLRAGDRQVHHRPGAARLALTDCSNCPPLSDFRLVCRSEVGISPCPATGHLAPTIFTPPQPLTATVQDYLAFLARLQSRFEELTSSDAQLVAAQHNPAITATPLA